MMIAYETILWYIFYYYNNLSMFYYRVENDSKNVMED